MHCCWGSCCNWLLKSERGACDASDRQRRRQCFFSRLVVLSNTPDIYSGIDKKRY